MKIVEGTAEEIIKYYNEKSYANKSNRYISNDEKVLSSVHAWHHWSKTKQEFISTWDMDKGYLLNLIRQKIRDYSSKINTNKLLLDDVEFKAFILALSYKILDE